MRLGLIIASVFLAITVSSTVSAQVAIVADGPSDFVKDKAGKLALELEELTRDSATPLEILPPGEFLGDYTLEGVKQKFREALSDNRVRLVIGIGFLAGVAAADIKPYPQKPVILPYASPEYQMLPMKGSTSGRRNLSYVAGNLVDFKLALSSFREVIDDRRVVFLAEEHFVGVMRKRVPSGIVKALEEEYKMDIVTIPPNVPGILQSLPDDVEAVFLPPTFRISFDEMEQLIQELNRRHIPTYAGMGAEWVEKGAFVTLLPAGLDTERFRKVALKVRDALDGEPLEDMTVRFPRRTELSINMGTARAIGIYPSFELLSEARVVRDDINNSRKHTLSLNEAVQEALNNNPGYKATLHVLKASQAQLRTSRGQLLPNVALSGGLTMVDEDQTSAIGTSEQTASYSVSAEQVIYSPLAIQAYRAQQRDVDATKAQRDGARLDLILEVVQSFLGVLQAQTVEELNRDNLRMVRTNRGLAELRVEIGSSGPQDIARWNIALAGGRADTIVANAQRNQAEINLNRILNAPSERGVVPKLPDESPDHLVINPSVAPFVRDTYSFRIYRDFMAQEALRNSPEIEELDAQIDVQRRLKSGYAQQLWLPTLSVSGSINHVLARGGAGADAPEVGGDGGVDPTVDAVVSQIFSSLPARPDFTWRVGVNLDFNLFNDSRYGTLSRIRQTLAQLRLQRGNLENVIEQRVRSALHQAGASAAAVNLRREAVKSARLNLSAVSSAYLEGTDTIVTLIDAQNQALQAEIGAANALYSYLSDFAAAERASGRFLRLTSADEQADFVARLETYAREQRAKDGIRP